MIHTTPLPEVGDSQFQAAYPETQIGCCSLQVRQQRPSHTCSASGTNGVHATYFDGCFVEWSKGPRAGKLIS
jgi:membrane-bound inhibitor of C-type lysozyme